MVLGLSCFTVFVLIHTLTQVSLNRASGQELKFENSFIKARSCTFSCQQLHFDRDSRVFCDDIEGSDSKTRVNQKLNGQIQLKFSKVAADECEKFLRDNLFTSLYPFSQPPVLFEHDKQIQNIRIEEEWSRSKWNKQRPFTRNIWLNRKKHFEDKAVCMVPKPFH